MNQGNGERSKLAAKVGRGGSVTQAEWMKTAAADSNVAFYLLKLLDFSTAMTFMQLIL